jgi:hypothetical protein
VLGAEEVTKIACGVSASRELFERARDTATVSYDPNCRPLLMGAPETVRDRIEGLVALADVVKVSAEDLGGGEVGRGGRPQLGPAGQLDALVPGLVSVGLVESTEFDRSRTGSPAVPPSTIAFTGMTTEPKSRNRSPVMAYVTGTAARLEKDSAPITRPI